ncbi:MAG TPA: cardiolipin synthase [Desulfohalobiaceae bacterium]|nr:cardiolipin synthase [Desulfohalobiaceae bacterium]
MGLFNWFVTCIVFFLMLISASHALLYKRDPKASWAWIITCILLPPLGPILYFLLGINRVRTKAKKLKGYWPFFSSQGALDKDTVHVEIPQDSPTTFLIPNELKQIAQISQAITNRPLLKKNSIDILKNGEQAYPAMLEAIDNARQRVFLTSYIFKTNKIGHEFIHSLIKAQQRGVDVRVLVDGVGEFYSLPRVGRYLKKESVPFARFLPLKLDSSFSLINLRNHRKILVIDGYQGFTGGMNIGTRHLAHNVRNPRRIQDMHFRLNGPIVHQMEQVFLEDWAFSTGEYEQILSPVPEGTGQALCRTITVGPNQDLNKLGMIMIGAASLAHKKLTIVTPYFLPSKELIGALQSAALRGVSVNIVLPAKNNLPYVQWATENMLWELLQYGVNIYYQPPPFAHTKLFLVDELYAHIGSANIDPRSLRLNFEMMVEVYEHSFVHTLCQHVNSIINRSRKISLHEIDARSFLIRTRDSICWLFSPYL